MNALLRLFLAHFIADFPLQTDFIFAIKKKGFWGCLIHSLIHAFVVIFLFLGSLRKLDFWIYVLLLVVVHSIQDWGKMKLWVKPEDDKITYFLLDQFLHYAFICVALFFPFSNKVAYFGKLFPAEVLLYYNSPGFIALLCAIVLAGWGGSVLLFYLDKSVYKNEVETLNRFERSYGVVERALVVFSLFKGGFFFILIPVLFLIRFSGVKNQPVYRGIFSLAFSVLVGIIFYQINLYIGG